MYNYATNPASSPTNSASSGTSDLSSASAWWGSGDVFSSTPSSFTSVSSGYSGFGEGPSNACMPGGPGQTHLRFSGMSQDGKARIMPQPSHSQARPPHNPSKYVSVSTQYVLATPQRVPILARVSVVDYRGNILYDSFVRPTHQIEDLRSSITGLLAEHLLSNEAMHPSAVKEQVSALFQGKIIIGHSLWMHFSLLGLTHPALDTRDVALYLPFHRSVSSSTVTPLKSLVSHLMRRKIGRSYEHPLEEARAALDLFRSYEDPWENEIRGGTWPSALPPTAFSQFFT
ncbi:hypothetical protein ACEPAI_1049 [Sanghuangporus weigelae]